MAEMRLKINGSDMPPSLLEAIEKQMIEQVLEASKHDAHPNLTNSSSSAESSTGKQNPNNGKRKAPEEEIDAERDIKKAFGKHFTRICCGSSDGDDGDSGSEFRQYLVQPEDIRETLADVHASPDVLEALDTLRLSTQYPEQFKFGILGNQPSLGVLLYGPPGTGKTLLARAVAKQASAKVISISGADIRSKYVGVGEKRIKDLFAYARKNAPCIIFIDEADSLFRSRSGDDNSRGHVNDITQFLAEMEGMSSSQGSKTPTVIAATNRPFDIDEGVLRRLGRRIHVEVPDKVGRERILAIQLAGENLDTDVRLSEIAAHTQDFTGSDLRALVWETAIQAVREIDWLQRDKTGDGSDKGSATIEARVLRREHFLRARQLISPAPKEDLVAQIADFHKRHGSNGKSRGGGARDPRASVINLKANGNDDLYRPHATSSSSSAERHPS